MQQPVKGHNQAIKTDNQIRLLEIYTQKLGASIFMRESFTRNNECILMPGLYNSYGSVAVHVKKSNPHPSLLFENCSLSSSNKRPV